MRVMTLVRLGILAVVVVGGVLAFVFRDRLTGSTDDVQVGDCVQTPAADEFSELQHRPCSEPHELEVFRLVDYPAQDAYPSEAEFEAFFGNQCLGTAFLEYTGLDFDDAAHIEASYFPPTAEAWADGGRGIICVLYPAGGGETTGSYRAG